MEMAGIKCRSSFSSAVQREILFQNAVSGMESWNENDLERASLPGLRMTDTLKTLRESESELAQAKQCLEQAYKALEFQFTNQEQDLQRVQSQFAALKSELESVAGRLANLQTERDKLQEDVNCTTNNMNLTRQHARNLEAQITLNAQHARDLEAQLTLTAQHARNLEAQLTTILDSRAWRVSRFLARVWRLLTFR